MLMVSSSMAGTSERKLVLPIMGCHGPYISKHRRCFTNFTSHGCAPWMVSTLGSVPTLRRLEFRKGDDV